MSGHLAGSCLPLSGHRNPRLPADMPARGRRADYTQGPGKQDRAASPTSPKITPLCQQLAKYGSLSFGPPALLDETHKHAPLTRSVENETRMLLEGCWVVVAGRPLGRLRWTPTRTDRGSTPRRQPSQCRPPSQAPGSLEMQTPTAELF